MEEGILQLNIMAWGWPVPPITGLLALLLVLAPRARCLARWIAWACVLASVVMILAFVSLHFTSRAPSADRENTIWFGLMNGGPLVVAGAVLLFLRNTAKPGTGNPQPS